MKKIFVAFALFLLGVVSLNAQSLAYREDTGESLSIGTNYTTEDKYRLGVALNHFVNKKSNQEVWALGFLIYTRNIQLTVDENARLLIRTFGDNIVELTQYIESPKQDYQSLGYNRYTNMSEYDYQVYPSYSISLADLKILMSEGIKKLRFETTRGMLDIDCERDVFGVDIWSEYNLIIGKTDFGEGF